MDLYYVRDVPLQAIFSQNQEMLLEWFPGVPNGMPEIWYKSGVLMVAARPRPKRQHVFIFFCWVAIDPPPKAWTLKGRSRTATSLGHPGGPSLRAQLVPILLSLAGTVLRTSSPGDPVVEIPQTQAAWTVRVVREYGH